MDKTETIIMASVFGGTLLVVGIVIIIILGIQCHQAKRLTVYKYIYYVCLFILASDKSFFFFLL